MRCSLCSKVANLLFNHSVHNLGTLCIECYMNLHGSCGVCQASFLPSTVLPDVEYQLSAKFIGSGKKHFIVCDSCENEIREKFRRVP